jgi:hypothetical protein
MLDLRNELWNIENGVTAKLKHNDVQLTSALQQPLNTRSLALQPFDAAAQRLTNSFGHST